MNLDQSIQRILLEPNNGIDEVSKPGFPKTVEKLSALFEEHSKERLLTYVDRVLESDTDLAKAGKSRDLGARYFNLMNHLIHWDKSTEEIEEMKELSKEEDE